MIFKDFYNRLTGLGMFQHQEANTLSKYIRVIGYWRVVSAIQHKHFNRSK